MRSHVAGSDSLPTRRGHATGAGHDGFWRVARSGCGDPPASRMFPRHVPRRGALIPAAGSVWRPGVLLPFPGRLDGGAAGWEECGGVWSGLPGPWGRRLRACRRGRGRSGPAAGGRAAARHGPADPRAGRPERGGRDRRCPRAFGRRAGAGGPDAGRRTADLRGGRRLRGAAGRGGAVYAGVGGGRAPAARRRGRCARTGRGGRTRSRHAARRSRAGRAGGAAAVAAHLARGQGARGAAAAQQPAPRPRPHRRRRRGDRDRRARDHAVDHPVLQPAPAASKGEGAGFRAWHGG